MKVEHYVVNQIWTWSLSIISLTLFSDNVHVTRDAMHSSLFEIVVRIVVVLDPIVGF